MELSKKAVFLDRDGVLNYSIIRANKPFPPQTLEEFKIYEDAFEALKKLKKWGFNLIVATNQPDIARNHQTPDVVETMHQKLIDKLPLDSIKMCTDETSSDYKPLPGMLLKSAKEFGLNLKESYMIGDRWRDIGAGVNAGCYKTILLDRNYNEKMIFNPDYICNTLTQATDYIIKQEGLKKYEK